MKFIFLDIDGVLNCESTKDRCGVFTGIEDQKVKKLAQIVAATGAEIILTSSWKYDWDKIPEKCDRHGDYLNEKCAKYGIRIKDKVDLGFNTNLRGRELVFWMVLKIAFQKEMVESFVILDDEEFDYSEVFACKGRFIKTSFYGKNGGLQDSHVREAIRILNEFPFEELNLYEEEHLEENGL